MTANRTFPIYLNNINQSCFVAKLVDQALLWHFRYGHLSFGGLRAFQHKRGLRAFQHKNMVAGLLHFSNTSNVCEEYIGNKQN